MTDVTINLGQVNPEEFQTLRGELAFAEETLQGQMAELSRWANEAINKVQNTPQERAEAVDRSAEVTKLGERIRRLQALRKRFG
jgi:hypothetical protein